MNQEPRVPVEFDVPMLPQSFVIEHFVGSRRGKWLKGIERYETHDAATTFARAQALREFRYGLLPIARRVVPA